MKSFVVIFESSTMSNVDINLIGKKGEDLACEFLKKQGFTIIDRNFHSRYGEIDIIAENKQYIIFVEVKLRSRYSLVLAQESVDLSKQKKILKTACEYLQKNIIEKQPRFDVIAINSNDINYIENAFDLGVLDEIF